MSKSYSVRSGEDKTLKQFFDRFYCIPKDGVYSDFELQVFKKYHCSPVHKLVAEGKDGYIVFRKKKKVSDEMIEIIKNDTASYRSKAKKYKLSLSTIYKIMNDKY